MQYDLDDLAIDTGRQQVTRGADPLPLPKLSFDLLLALVQAAPNVVSLDELMRLVWPGVIVSPETVSQCVKLLRDALGDDPRRPRYIGGLRGRGYQIVAAVTEGAQTPKLPGEPHTDAAVLPTNPPLPLTETALLDKPSPSDSHSESLPASRESATAGASGSNAMRVIIALIALTGVTLICSMINRSWLKNRASRPGPTSRCREQQRITRHLWTTSRLPCFRLPI
jgi:DNA-binding winged helix-turn-helix (wHTH) protein